MTDNQTTEDVSGWSSEEVKQWLDKEGYSDAIKERFRLNEVDGFTLLKLTEDDLRKEPMSLPTLGAIKHVHESINALRPCQPTRNLGRLLRLPSDDSLLDKYWCHCQPNERRFARQLQPHKFKTFIAALYASVVLYFCAFMITIVNDRVPDMEKYPPLPDLFLDNVPYIPWAFSASEYIALLLVAVFLIVILTHRHRFIILRRFLSLGGTLYLLRAVCMLITSLSVPCRYFECQRHTGDGVRMKMVQALHIMAAGGMSIHGVRYCGDYMFSGHTTFLTLINLFIDEYSHKDYPVVRTLGWVLNLFGIFFVMAGHEHYSIDVFIAFYLTTRLFLYYHTLADNHNRLRYDERRVRVWFPLFSYFESDCDGAVPYEFEWPLPSFTNSKSE